MDAYLLSPEALEDLQRIWDFIALDNVRSADKVLDEFFDAFEKLAQWPRQGHTRSDLTDRDVSFWPVGPILLYTAKIPRLFRSWPSSKGPGTLPE